MTEPLRRDHLELITVKEAARRLGIHHATYYEWLKRGIVPKPITIPGGRSKVRSDELDDAILAFSESDAEQTPTP